MILRIFYTLIAAWLACGGAAWARDVRFSLQSANGEITEKHYPDQYLLLAFGYTSCPDICPTTLYDIANTLKKIKHPEAVQAVFVSIDPLADDPARLQAYTEYFDPRIIGLTGDMAHIQSLTKLLGASFGYRLNGKTIDQPEAGTPYTVYHSTWLYLISPTRQLVERFDYRIGAPGLAKELDRLLDPVAAPQTVASAPQTANADTACPLPEGFSQTNKPLTLKSILPDAAPEPVALVNLWALWCQPCREELPLLDALAAQPALAVHALNLGDDPQQIAELFNTLHINHLAPTRSDDGDVLERIGAVGLPYSALFLEGTLFAAKAGIIDDTDSLAAFAQCYRQP